MKRFADCLEVPDSSRAILWDMDGVLLDTLQLDYEIVNVLLKEQVPSADEISREAIRANFAYSLPDFWRRILATTKTPVEAHTVDALVLQHNHARAGSEPDVLAGVPEILEAGRANHMKMAVASNNQHNVISQMLKTAGLIGYFDTLVGTDVLELARKPAPDMYLEAARRMSVEPALCVVIEDSLLGLEAGCRAGCYTIGVATGAATLEALAASGFASVAYESFSSVCVP